MQEACLGQGAGASKGGTLCSTQQQNGSHFAPGSETALQCTETLLILMQGILCKMRETNHLALAYSHFPTAMVEVVRQNGNTPGSMVLSFRKISQPKDIAYFQAAGTEEFFETNQA